MNAILERPRRRREINIVPLVDVLIVLIFFFLVSMQFRNLKVLNIVFPKIETAGINKKTGQIEIVVTAGGKLFYNGKQMTEQEMLAALAAAAAVNRNLPVLLMADENSALKHVTRVVDQCRGLGLEKVRLQSR